MAKPFALSLIDQSQNERLLTKHEVANVFSISVKIPDNARMLLEHSEEMSFIAINAGIAAANSNFNKEAFLVLAEEAGKIAKRMGELVRFIQTHCEGLARRSLLGVERARIVGKLDESRQRIRCEGNHTLVSSAISASHETIEELMNYCHVMQGELSLLQSAIDNQNKRIGRIAVYFRIEASRSNETVESVDSFYESLTRLSEAVSRIIGNMADFMLDLRAANLEMRR